MLKYTLFSSKFHVIERILLMEEDSRQSFVISTGLFGRLGSAPGLLVGMRFFKYNILLKLSLML